MSLTLFNAVPVGAIEVLFDYSKQPWPKQVDVGNFIGIKNMRDVTAKFSTDEKKSRSEITVNLTDRSSKPFWNDV